MGLNAIQVLLQDGFPTLPATPYCFLNLPIHDKENLGKKETI